MRRNHILLQIEQPPEALFVHEKPCLNSSFMFRHFSYWQAPSRHLDACTSTSSIIRSYKRIKQTKRKIKRVLFYQTKERSHESVLALNFETNEECASKDYRLLLTSYAFPHLMHSLFCVFCSGISCDCASYKLMRMPLSLFT